MVCFAKYIVIYYSDTVKSIIQIMNGDCFGGRRLMC